MALLFHIGTILDSPNIAILAVERRLPLWQTIQMNMIKSLRKKRGLTQAALAALVGWDTSTIQRLESGKRKLKLEQIVALSQALGVHAGEIFPAKQEPSAIAELIELLQGMNEDERETLLKVAKGLAGNKQDKLPPEKPPRVA